MSPALNLNLLFNQLNALTPNSNDKDPEMFILIDKIQRKKTKQASVSLFLY